MKPPISLNRPRIALALAAAGGTALLAHNLSFDEPPGIDRRVRYFVRTRIPPEVAMALRPLFPLGLPGGYITIAYAMSLWLRRRKRSGGPAIVTAAWMGWLVHRAAKLVYLRERPRRPGAQRRIDSYPSGHTTGATALAITTALVLRRQGLLSNRMAFIIAAGAPAAMGAYRVIADDHWTTDAFGGWLLGGAIGLMCDSLMAPAVKHRRNWATGATK